MSGPAPLFQVEPDNVVSKPGRTPVRAPLWIGEHHVELRTELVRARKQFSALGDRVPEQHSGMFCVIQQDRVAAW